MSKYKIKANRKQLEAIGIDFDLDGLVGMLVQKFPDGYYTIRVKHSCEAGTIDNVFDIPSSLLTEIK